MTSSPRAAAGGAAALLLLGGLAGIGWAVRPDADLPQAASAGLLAAGAIAMALSSATIRTRPRLRIPVAAVLTALVADRVISTGGDAGPAAAAATCGLVLGWAALAVGPGTALRMSPALTVGHAAAIAGAGESLVLVAVSPVAALAFELVAWPLHALRAARADRRLALRGVDVLVVAADDLRSADVLDVGDRVCRLAADLLRARGAVLYTEGPGKVVVAGTAGTHPTPNVGELAGDRRVEAVLRGAPLQAGEPLVVPVVGETGVVGAVAVHGARRPLDDLHTGLLELFANEAGAALDRVARRGLAWSSVDADPVSLVAGLRAGDGLVLLEVDGLPQLRTAQGEQAATALLDQVHAHLRRSTRPGDSVARFEDDRFVIVLRDLKAPVDVVLRRIAESWLQARPGRSISVGAAVHLAGAAPLDTLERTRSSLTSTAGRPAVRLSA